MEVNMQDFDAKKAREITESAIDEWFYNILYAIHTDASRGLRCTRYNRPLDVKYMEILKERGFSIENISHGLYEIKW